MSRTNLRISVFAPTRFSVIKFASACLASLLLGSQAMAGAAQWSSTNIQYLAGSSYESIFFDSGAGKLSSKEDSNSIITIEHVNGWKYGDNFLFVDITNPDSSDAGAPTGYYGEISPRLSFSKMTGKDLSAGIVKDVLITTTAEIGQGFHTYLYGLAVDLDIFSMPVFQINYYVRNETKYGADTGSQVTLVWLKPFDIGALSLTFEGFFDYAFDMDHAEDNIVTGPRLLLDLGKLWGAAGVLQAGVEYQIWRNKFGIDGIDEDVAQAMVKWIW
ncbi:MAG: nucleoside-specific outer membrane channel protein Tsx [Zhongshania marina]|jgi:nucleoside-specific outer membrane channel protein Tsx